MEPHPRYEIFAEIASGDFSTVYRGRDRELGREVAIKQIHRQFLSDARQLDRYWHEAQLLASLQHRNIMTIYDIVRPRGWLILELMQANLDQLAHGEPMDLDQLRLALTCSLQALQFLHENGVIHGDIKPSNLFVDQRKWVKLGDFGLARRVSNDRGSLLKGTTRYMAPELVSEQFGPVGPASDLYSLGFTAYELMCGARFETLFPGLEAFGRDKQVAWMMWHAAADRRLPEIHRVLEGVPDDLAKVIQKLTAKNPAQRYRTAAEALADLQIDPSLADTLAQQGPTPEQLAAEARRKKRRRRLGIAATFFLGLLLIGGVALLNRNPPSAPPPKQLPPVEGIVRNVLPEKHTLVIESDGKPLEYTLRSQDRLSLNGKASLLRDLLEGDRLKVEKLTDEAGRSVMQISASRPERHQGVIAELQPDEGLLSLTVAGSDKPLRLKVPQNLVLRLNNLTQVDGVPVSLASLAPGDQVSVEHDGDSELQTATALSAIRGMTATGLIREIDAGKKTLTLALGRTDDAKLVTWPIGEGCEITLNDHRFLDGRVIKPADLRPGDEATVVHDTTVLRVAASRVFHQSGLVLDVRSADHVLDVRLDDGGKTVSWTVAAECSITLNDATVELADLHRGDQVSVTHDAPDSKGAEVSSIEATRGTDPRKWALVIGIQAYEDAALSPLRFAAADAKLMADTLGSRYQVSPEQMLVLTDVSRIRLEQSVPAFLDKLPADAELIVYFDGHAYADAQAKVYLASTDFTLTRAEATGVPLEWFVGAIEKCAAKDKLLLFDACHAGKGADLKQQPSSAEMLMSLKTPGALSPLRNTTAVASCRSGQRGQDLSEQEHGRFAWFAAEGLTGRADRNRDGRIEATELYEFLAANVPGKAGQTPQLILPDATPPRLSEPAKVALRKLSADLQGKPDLKKAAADYEAAQELVGKEPEARLLYLLFLTKARKEKEAFKLLDELKSEQPELLPAIELGIWLHFRKQNYVAGTADLVQLLTKLSAGRAKANQSAEDARLLGWAGRLREFAALAAAEAARPPAALLEELDAAVEKFPPKAQKLYAGGRQHVREVAGNFDKQIASEADKSGMLKLQVQRRQLVNYATFPLDTAAKSVLDRLNQ